MSGDDDNVVILSDGSHEISMLAGRDREPVATALSTAVAAIATIGLLVSGPVNAVVPAGLVPVMNVDGPCSQTGVIGIPKAKLVQSDLERIKNVLRFIHNGSSDGSSMFETAGDRTLSDQETRAVLEREQSTWLGPRLYTALHELDAKRVALTRAAGSAKTTGVQREVTEAYKSYIESKRRASAATEQRFGLVFLDDDIDCN